jgi:hypothetical protein
MAKNECKSRRMDAQLRENIYCWHMRRRHSRKWLWRWILRGKLCRLGTAESWKVGIENKLDFLVLLLAFSMQFVLFVLGDLCDISHVVCGWKMTCISLKQRNLNKFYFNNLVFQIGMQHFQYWAIFISSVVGSNINIG